MIAEPLRRFLEDRHVQYHVHAHTPRTTAKDVATVTFVPWRSFAKPVLVRVFDAPPGRFILVVLPASARLDLERLEDTLGFPVELAHEDDFRRIFPDYEPGSAPPIGELAVQHVAAFIDVSLTRSSGIAFAGGSPTDVVEMPRQEYERIAAHRVIDCTLPH